jgi:hypothetical protein
MKKKKKKKNSHKHSNEELLNHKFHKQMETYLDFNQKYKNTKESNLYH